MSWLLDMTPGQPVSVTLSTTSETRQRLDDAIDLGGCDAVDLELVIVSISPPGTPVIIGLATGLQTQSEDGWISNRSSPSLNFIPAAAGAQVRTFRRGMLRYLRWVIQPVAAGGVVVTFYLRGMARKPPC